MMDKLKKNMVFYLLLLIDFYIVPWFIKNTGSAMIVMLVIIPLICLITSVFYGIRNGFNFWYILIVAIMFAPSIFIFYNSSAWVYVVGYAVIALLGNLIALNLLLTFLIFDVRAPFTEQYQRLVPNAGTFGYTLYQISPLLMAVVYSFFNSLALALFAVFALAIQMIVKFKNQYVAIVIPVILLYAITFAFDSVPLLLPYDIRIIIQPRSANAITEIVTKQDFEITFCAWIVADSFLTLIGLARNKNIL